MWVKRANVLRDRNILVSHLKTIWCFDATNESWSVLRLMHLWRTQYAVCLTMLMHCIISFPSSILVWLFTIMQSMLAMDGNSQLWCISFHLISSSKWTKHHYQLWQNNECVQHSIIWFSWYCCIMSNEE